MGRNIKNKRFLKVAAMGIFAALFCVGCGDKGTGDEEPTYHTITLDADGGEVTPEIVTGRRPPGGYKVAYVSLPKAIKEGYTFKGWYTEKDGVGYECTEYFDTAWTTLYAHWTLAHYTITFDAHGGEVFPAHETTGNDWRLASLPTPTRADHTFDGWYMDVVGVRERVTESKVYREDVTLYAHWIYTGVHYTITFDATGGTVDPATEETDVGGILQDLPTPERAGYAFTGWYTEKTGGTTVSTSTVFNSAATVYAQWILITDGMYTITFNAHGGIVAPKSGTTGENGKLLVPLPTPTREGYTFMGWYTEDDKVTDNTIFRENTAIHATWNIIHYVVTFDAAGGTVTPTTTKTGSHWEIDTLPAPKREGYTFIGWYTEKDGGTHVFTKSTVLIGDISGNISIYAHWAENPPSLVDDRDDKAYKVVAIGEQIWMAENLNYAGEAGGELGVCYEYDDSNCEIYGRLYSWREAVKACPVGWRLPTDNDWTEMAEFIGSENIGKKLSSRTGWDKTDYLDLNGTDDFGFSALPAGYGHVADSVVFGGAKYQEHASWWTATELDADDAWYRDMRHNDFMRYHYKKSRLLSVRCLQE